MEVVAVSFSRPEFHVVDGVRTLTSIIRKPCPSIELSSAGIVGNSTAAHDAPVYIFFANHYDYWATKLGVERSEWDWCHWGENITFKCSPLLNEHNFHLGDIWSVGSSVRLQVCGSRVPCNKLSWRCGQSAKWLRELADSGFCGVYMRILHGGIIVPGDEADLVESHPENMSSAAISKLAFDSSLRTKDTLNLLVQSPHFLGMGKSLFRRKLSVIHDAEILGKNAWTGWRIFKPIRIVDEGDDIRSFYFKPLDPMPLATYLPGQFLSIRLPTGLVRNWSISDWVDHASPEYYRISIKKATNGSRWMHEQCTLDTAFEIRSPAGGFHLDWTPIFASRQVYISAGIGVTPIMAMLKAHVSHYAMSLAPALWIHVCPNGSSITRLLLELVGHEKMVQQIRFFTKPRSQDVLGKDYHFRGRPSLEMLEGLISGAYTINPLNITPIELPGPLSTFYICGPHAFETEMKSLLVKLGVGETSVKSEIFSQTVSMSSVLRKGEIRFAKSKKAVRWDRGKTGGSPSVLEIAEEAGLTPEYGCRVGSCGSCRVTISKGSVAGGMQPDGSVYICCARPSSKLIEIQL